MGGGRKNSVSILETIDILADIGYKLKYSYKDTNRIGDHMCHISDLTKYDLPGIIQEIVNARRAVAA
jgi:CDP-paratose 2-epimerase